MATHFHQLRKNLNLSTSALLEVCQELNLKKGESSVFANSEAEQVRARLLKKQAAPAKAPATATLTPPVEPSRATTVVPPPTQPQRQNQVERPPSAPVSVTPVAVTTPTAVRSPVPPITVPSPLRVPNNSASVGANTDLAERLANLVKEYGGPSAHFHRRIYALAKELNLDSKSLVDLGRAAGLSGIGSALASIDLEGLLKLKQYVSSDSYKQARQTAAPPELKAEVAVTVPPVASTSPSALPSTSIPAANVSPSTPLANVTPAAPATNSDVRFASTEGWRHFGMQALSADMLRDRFGLHFSPSLIRSIAAWLPSHHLLLCGPPGSGKTELAKALPSLLFAESRQPYILATAHSSWSAHDVIGGMTIMNGSSAFVPGVFTEAVIQATENQGQTWLILDEINRADIDRAMGPMFTALEDFYLNVQLDPTQGTVERIPVPRSFRVIATMNTSDKNHLFPMSNALKRRFAVIDVQPASQISEYQILHSRLDEFLRANTHLSPERASSIIAEPTITEFLRKLADVFANLRSQASRPDENEVPELHVGTAIPLGVCKFVVASLLDNDSHSAKLDDLVDEALGSTLLPQFENLNLNELRAVEKVLEDAAWNLPRCLRKLRHWQSRYRD